MDSIIFVKQKDIFTVRAAADYLTVCPKTVYKLIREKELDASKFGRHYKITADSLSRYISKNMVG